MIKNFIFSQKARFKLKYKEALPRIIMDILLINFSLMLSFLLWYVFSIKFLGYNTNIYEKYIQYYTNSFYFISLTCIIVFFLFGFYTHTRSYRSQYKAWTIFKAVTLSYLVYTFMAYFLLTYTFIPRGITLLAWVVTLLTIGGARLSKVLILRYFSIEKRNVTHKSIRNIKNILVVGGAGYIGSVLVKNLLKENYYVRVLDSLLFEYQPLEGMLKNPRLEFVQGDFRIVEHVVKSVKDMDAVVHLGAIVGDPACSIDEELSLEINTAATHLIKQVCKGFGIKKFLYASTCSVYGATNDLINEKSRLNPVSLYAKSKIDAEKAVLAMTDSTFSPTVLRLSTAFGHSYRPRFDLVVNLLTAKATKEGNFSIYNGFQWRPFIHIEDISRAILLLLEAPAAVTGDEIFNVGSNNMNFQIADLGIKIKEIIPQVQIENIENKEDFRNYRVSFEKFRNILGFSCKRTLEEGILEINQALKTGTISDYKDPKFNNYRFLQGINLEKNNLFKIGSTKYWE